MKPTRCCQVVLPWFTSVLLREREHTWAALRQVVSIQGVTLYFVCGTTYVRLVPLSPGGCFRLDAAGPLVNSILARLFGLV